MAPRLKNAVNDALELASGERDEFLVHVFAGNEQLLAEARGMLAAHAQLGNFLEPPDVSRGLWARALEREPPAARRTPALVGAVLDDRYQLEERLGRGSSGAVYDAADLLTGERVAVKVLTALQGGDLHWFRRELAALRLLELPGVVRLLDDGVHMGLPFLVMPKIDGTRFPGVHSPVPWAELAGPAIALLETLARIHARGVVHGDLKPANVLVDAKLRPMVLDLGLSSGPSVPGRIDSTDGIAGTPAYLAPEQLLSQSATPLSDLYSVGVMLHEALTGMNPHPAHSLDALVEARLEHPAPSLRDRGIDAATCPVDTLDALLALEPADREPSAARVAAKLRGDFPPLELLRNHPVLQLDDTVNALTKAARSSSQVTFFGPPRSGRARCLRRVAGRLRREGKSVLWLDAQAAAHPPLGDVVIVDGAHTLVGPGPSCVIRVVESPAADSICVRPLDQDALKSLFRGTDRIFHLLEDSARELYRRTRGWQIRIIEELSAWLRAGLARVEERAIAIDRDSLDLLASGFRVCPIPDESVAAADPVLSVLGAAGPVMTADALVAATQRSPAEVRANLAVLVRDGKVDQSADGLYQTTSDSIVFPRKEDHEAVARGLAPGTPGRLLHLVASNAAEAITGEACDATLQLMRAAMVGRARATATEGLASIRGHGLGVEHELALLSVLLQVASADGSERGFELALYEIERSSFESREMLRLERLARVALLALRRDGDRALALADALGPMEEPELEQLRQGARAMAARTGQRDRSEEVLGSIEAWAAENDAAEMRRKLLEWKGWAHYMQFQFKEAVATHEEAMELAHDARSRLFALLNVAETGIEAGLYERACELAEEAKKAAAHARHPLCEARAEAILRFAAYRSGSADGVDLELIDASRSLHLSNLKAQINLNEGAVAWRLGELATARRLVRTASNLWREIGPWGAMLTRAFLSAMGENCAVESLEQRARDCPLPGAALQTIALLARGHPERARRYREHAAKFVEQIPFEYRALRREVLSVDECLEWLQIERTE